jgi:cytidine deaminase
MSDPSLDELLGAAITARERSHAPFSRFHVGAAVRGASGTVYTGSNIESSSYGLTICAERLALCIAIHSGEQEITEIAVVCSTQDAPGPCGACRQFMVDFAPDAVVLMANLEGARRTATVAELMPWGFGPRELEAASKGDPGGSGQ